MVTPISLPKAISNELKKLVINTVDIYKDNVKKIILFGSFATNQYQPDSDFDICLVLNKQPDTNSEKLKIRNLAEECHISRNVDVVVCTQEELMNSDMVFKYIRRDGVVLYEQI